MTMVAMHGEPAEFVNGDSPDDDRPDQDLQDEGPPADAELTTDTLAQALEAVCFALNRPLTATEAASILDCPAADLDAAMESLAGALRGRGLMLQRHGGELQLVTRPEVAWAVQRALNPERPGRLSRASLETLAIVAYRQPITRAAVEAIRGVSCDAVLDNLERRELITEVGRQETPGHPRLFGTTLRFLQVVGLERIEELPPLGMDAALPSLPDADWGPDASDGSPAAAASPAEGAAGGLLDEAADEGPSAERARAEVSGGLPDSVAGGSPPDSAPAPPDAPAP